MVALNDDSLRFGTYKTCPYQAGNKNKKSPPSNSPKGENYWPFHLSFVLGYRFFTSSCTFCFVASVFCSSFLAVTMPVLSTPQ